MVLLLRRALLLQLLVAAAAVSYWGAVGAVLPSGPHIADLSVLLPPRLTNPVEYRLQAYGGCFSWSWDHHDILFVQPEYNSSNRCSTSARLISIAPYVGRKETAVYATDLHSGTVIRCEVFVDMITRIKIFHHSLKLDLDGLATLRIHAFDEEDNVFSSLVGLQFLWQLLPKSVEADGIHNLIHIPLKDTPLSDCGHFCGGLETRIDLEERGIGSDLYVVKGIGIGHEVVTAKLFEPHLDHVVDEIVLTVAEAMSIDPPSPVFITVGARVNYILKIIHLNSPQVIELPSPNHRWYSLNTSVARVDSVMGIAHSLHLGVTDIVVEDTRVSSHLQTSTMHVVIPGELRLYILPVINVVDPVEGAQSTPSSTVWYVFPGQEYIIYVKAYSKGYEAKELHITENNNLKLESNKVECWKLFSVSDSFLYAPQNSWLLKAISPGQGFLAASLTYYNGKSDVPEVLKVGQEVVVCSKVKLLIREEDEVLHIIRLPWAPGIYQEIELKASGGCAKMMEDYSWYSSNMEIVSASASGLLRAKHPGQAVIKVVSIFDPTNYDEILVEVSVPYSMVMVPFFPVEAVVGTDIEAAVTLQSSNGTYYRCDAFSNIVRWKVFSENESFKFVNTSRKALDSSIVSSKKGYEQLYSSPCAWTCLYAAGVGRAVLHATLTIELQSLAPSSDRPFILKAAASIAAYSPLVVRQAGNGNRYGGYWVDSTKVPRELHATDYQSLEKLYLVPGSGMEILLLGGPERWDKKVEYIETVEVLGDHDQSEGDGLLVQQASNSGGRLYKVLCGTPGNFKLLFSRGNLAADDHPLPFIAHAKLSVICSFPSSIALIANEPASTTDVIEAAIKAARGPGRIRISPVTISNGCTIRVAAIGIHSSTTAFANSSSLYLRWELSGCEKLAYWANKDSFDESGPTWEQFLVLQNSSGLCTVRATVVGFSETMTSHVHKNAYQLLEHAENNLTDALRLQLVSRLRVIPDFVLLVNSPEAKVNLSVTGGTCFLEVVTNDTKVVQIQTIESSKCSHLMLSAIGLGSAVVKIRDVALSPPAIASVEVRVANVDWINIVSPEEISLMEGSMKEFDILAGTEDGMVFDSSQYMYMDMHVHIEDGILDLVNRNDSPKAGSCVVFEPKFSVKASQLGTATLYVSVRLQSGHEISSQFIKVEVYKPLQVHPDYIYLVPGASYVITVKGGPAIRAFGEYSSMNSETAVIESSSGRVTAISVGNATVRATVYGNGGTFICEAYGTIEVEIPTALSLNLQSDKLCVGCRMPIFPSFSKGTLFSFYEVCRGYKWMLEDDQVLSFQMARSLNSDADKVPLTYSEEKSSLYYRDDFVIGFINVLLGRSAGRTKVSILFSCDFVSPGSTETVVYNASKTLRVVPDPPLAHGIPITWVIPPYYITSDLLPASTESEGLIDSHDRRRIVYTVLKTCGNTEYAEQDAITIDGSKIRTKESNNLACIQAKDQTTRRMEIASCVRVAEIAQLRVTTTESPFHVVYLAVNAKVELVISYCDNLGYPFSEAHDIVPLEIETNYPDILALLKQRPDNVIETNNDNIFLQAIKPGRALVRIAFDQNPKKADYILVSVGAQVYPRNPVVHVGHYLNFSIVGDVTDGLRLGQWSSSNGSIVQINRMSGEAHARHEGAAQVTFQGSDFNMQTPVTVLKVDEIVVEAPPGTLTNVQFLGGYEFPVRIRVPSDMFEATGNRIDVPYSCTVDPPHVGFAKSWSDPNGGNSFCLFFPYSPKHLLSSLSKSNSISPKERHASDEFVYVTIIASLNEAPHVMGSARALFVGGFSVLDGGKLNLTPSFNTSLITIVGNKDVEIYWNAKDLLSVQLLTRDDFGMVSRLQYEIKALKQQQFSDKVTIQLPATGQTAEVDVNYENGERTSPVGKSGITWFAVLLCSAALLLTVFIFIRLLDRPRRSHQHPTREGGAAAASPIATPDRSTAGSIQSSPHTPPRPFMDYVRRTIDETPYYKRNARRRFDPQYTY